jgi:hypothetical protein
MNRTALNSVSRRLIAAFATLGFAGCASGAATEAGAMGADPMRSAFR